MSKCLSWSFIFLTLTVWRPTEAKSIQTNAVVMHRAPDWVRAVDVEEITNRIQYKLEWSTRRIQVYWYATQSAFEKSHSLGAVPVAVTRASKTQQTIHLGPKVVKKNFAGVFGHELVHVIFAQKYAGSIPKWLEEGLANLLSKNKKVNYKWLAEQPFPLDVRTLTHPYKGRKKSIKYHYIASLALAEMLEKNCDLENLIRLSVQRKMVDYIKTYCEIKDVNKAFQTWVKTKRS